MAQEKRLTREEIEQVLTALKREHPHTYFFPGKKENDPGWVVILKSINAPAGVTFTSKQLEDMAQKIAEMD